MGRYIRYILLTLFIVIVPLNTFGKDIFFADGYHGGIYGHYPVAWKTDFIVSKLNENPNWLINLEIEPETWDVVKQRTPMAFDAFSNLLSSGRMEYTNPTYAQPYCFNITGESIIRQFYFGIKSLQRNFPGIEFSTYSAEEPCFTSSLPAILKGFKFKYASLKCPDTCWGGYMAAFGGQLVDWVGPDSTSILTVPRYACEDLEKNSVWQTTAWCNSDHYIKACKAAGIDNPIGMCFQDAGWRNGPWLGDNKRGSKYVLWTDYIQNYTNHIDADRHHFTQDDVLVNLMWGSQVLQQIARNVRNAENMMVMSEKVGAMVSLLTDGAETMDFAGNEEAWRQLMLAQHHDSWIVPYNRLNGKKTWADMIGEWTSYASNYAEKEITRLSECVDSGKDLMVKVFNTTMTRRNEVVSVVIPNELYKKRITLTDEQGNIVNTYIESQQNGKIKDKRLFFKASVPSFGYATYKVSVSENDSLGLTDSCVSTSRDVDAKQSVILENDKVRVEINTTNGGYINSLVLKDVGMEYAPESSSEHSLCELRGYFYDENRFRSSKESKVRRVTSQNIGPVKRVAVESEIAGHPFELIYTLKDGSTRIDCELEIDWKRNVGIGEYREMSWQSDRRAFSDDRYKLCLLLPTSFGADRLWKEAPFDVFESKQDSTFFNRWSEIRNNIILSWIDFSDKDKRQGLGLLTDHTTSYVHGPGYPTALTLQYSGLGLWGRNYALSGPSKVKFALVPHVGTTGAKAISNESENYNEPLIAVFSQGSGNACSKTLIASDAIGYQISSARCISDGNVEVRFFNRYESGRGNVTFDIDCANIVETNLLGETIAIPKTNRLQKGSFDLQLGLPINGFQTFVIQNDTK